MAATLVDGRDEWFYSLIKWLHGVTNVLVVEPHLRRKVSLSSLPGQFLAGLGAPLVNLKSVAHQTESS
jgi:hypothetical protein